jgi:hypothetical protein
MGVHKLATLCFFWDYDTQWGGDRSRGPGGPKNWGHLEFENTERLLELHDQYEVPACFAVVGAAALPGIRPYHDPAQVRRIHAAGHEVGSHAFKHEWLPALDYAALVQTLRRSKSALEQCIGAEVITFVPPYNQPFDYVRGGSLSLSERREVRSRERTDLQRLCTALRETGYRFCRIAYRPMQQRLAEMIARRDLQQPAHLEDIGGITCIRLNTPGGFDTPTHNMLERSVRQGGIVVVYGHPHSLYMGNTQDEQLLVPFLSRVQQLCQQGQMRVCLPRHLVVAGTAESPVQIHTGGQSAEASRHEVEA